MEIIAAVVLVCALVALWWSARSAITVCVLDVTNGHATRKSGRISPRLLADIDDVVRKPKVARATLRVVRSSGLAELQIKGEMTEAQRQQLRNVVGSVPLAKLGNA